MDFGFSFYELFNIRDRREKKRENTVRKMLFWTMCLDRNFYLSCKQKFSHGCRVYHSIYDAPLVEDVPTPTCEHSLPRPCNHLVHHLPSYCSSKVSHQTTQSCYPSQDLSVPPARESLHPAPPQTDVPRESGWRPSEPKDYK